MNADSGAEKLEAVARALDGRARAFEDRKDGRCVFTHAYALMTRRIAADLETSGLDDPGWVVDVAEAFAERYFYAVEAYDRGGETPPAWHAVFAAITGRKTSVVEDLVFGVYAHIVRDLPHTLQEVGLVDADGCSRLHDHHVVTAIVGRTIDPIQEAVAERYGPYVRSLDRLARGQDEILTEYGIRLSRGMAWYNALRLDDARMREHAAAAVERSPQVFVEQVLRPPPLSARVVLRGFRWLVAHLRRWPEGSGTSS